MNSLPETSESTTKPRSELVAGKRLVALIFLAPLIILLVTLLGLEAMTLLAEQQIEQQRRAIAIAGGKSETERHSPLWIQKIMGPDFHSFFDRTRLVSIVMTGENIVDAKLQKVSQVPDLVSLDLQNSHITNEGLKTISKLESLKYLNLRGTEVTSLKPLASLPQLDTLLINFSQVRGPGLEDLSQFPKLQFLGAGGLKIDDRAVEILAKCRGLEELSINGAVLGESGLKPLHALKDLKMLSLKDATVDPADLSAFKQALPGCKIGQ